MSGGGSSAPAQPSTTTTVQDIPAWEQGYVTNLLGQAQTEAAQPYQQFTGPQVAGFTPDQTQAFSNIENAGGTNAANQAAATGQVNQGVNSANSIYGAGAGDINAATAYNPLAAVAPYLGAASTYNSATAAQPYLNQSQGYNAAAAGVATPQGIQSYLSPYTSNVVQGIQNEANENWNQNIMPGVNNEFTQNGQFGSGRDAQVLGQAAGNFQTGLSANVANALQSGYTTAGQQAATEAGILGNSANTAISGGNAASAAQGAQVSNLLNQANAAGSSTQQQASNLLGQGTALGNLANTQTGEQLAAGQTLGNLGAQQAATNLTQNQALQATGQEQQELNQTNLNTAMQNFNNQVQYPEQQTQFLNQIVRGLPTPTASTSAGQTTPAYSVSPLSAIGGAGVTGLALTGQNGNTLGTATQVKKGGLIKGYAAGGTVTTGDDDDAPTDPLSQMAMYNAAASSDPSGEMANAIGYKDTLSPLDLAMPDDREDDEPTAAPMPQRQESAPISRQAVNPLDMPQPPEPPSNTMFTPQQMQQNQLLALARGLLTPSIGGSTAAAVGQGVGNLADVTLKQQQMMQAQNQLNYENQMKQYSAGIEKQKADQENIYPYKDPITGKVTMLSRSDMLDKQNGVQGDNQQATSSGGGNTSQETAFGGSISGLSSNMLKTKAAAKEAQTIVDNNNNNDKYLTEAQRSLDDIRNNNATLAKSTYADPGSVLGQGQTQFGKLYGSAAAKASQALDSSTQDLATNLNALQYKPGTRGGALQLKTVLASKPIGSNFTDTNDQRINEIQSQVAQTQLENKLVNSFVEKNPAGTLAADDFNAYDLRDALSKKFPLYVNGKYQPDNAQKWEDSIPDAIQHPYSYLSSSRSAPVGDAGNPPPSSASSSSGKVVSQSDLAAVAQKYGKTIDQVRQDAIAKGYKIQ